MKREVVSDNITSEEAVRRYAALVWRVHQRLKSARPAGKLDDFVLYSYDPDRKVETLPNN